MSIRYYGSHILTFLVAIDFYNNVVFSPFGMYLTSRAREKGTEKLTPGLLAHGSPMSPEALGYNKVEFVPGYDRFGVMNPLHKKLHFHWLAVMHDYKVEDILGKWTLDPEYDGHTAKHIEDQFRAFDGMWKEVDRRLWESAFKMDREGEKGRTAREYGLFDPEDPARPTFLKTLQAASNLKFAAIIELLLGGHSPPVPQAVTKVEEKIPAFEISTPSAQSGHSYSIDGSSVKAKTKGPAVEAAVDAQLSELKLDDSENEGEMFDDFPNLLPSSYKLPRKVLKVFHNVLDLTPEDQTPGAPKRSTVRWTDFEKVIVIHQSYDHPRDIHNRSNRP